MTGSRRLVRLVALFELVVDEEILGLAGLFAREILLGFGPTEKNAVFLGLFFLGGARLVLFELAQIDDLAHEVTPSF